MKKLILLAFMSTFAMSGMTNESANKAIENDRLCKIFTKKAETYESTMRDDSLAEATLVSYKKRVSVYCNSTSVTS